MQCHSFPSSKEESIVSVDNLKFAKVCGCAGSYLVPNGSMDIIEDDRKDYDKKIGRQWASLSNPSALLAICGVTDCIFDSELRASIEGLNNTDDFVWDSNSFKGI